MSKLDAIKCTESNMPIQPDRGAGEPDAAIEELELSLKEVYDIVGCPPELAACG